MCVYVSGVVCVQKVIHMISCVCDGSSLKHEFHAYFCIALEMSSHGCDWLHCSAALIKPLRSPHYTECQGSLRRAVPA